MSRAEHEGRGLEEFMAPVSERFLIPIFFVSLGLRVDWAIVGSLTGVTALGTGGLLLGVREILHRRWLRLGGDQRAYLLLCPNLPVVALGASTLLEAQAATGAAGWLLLTGLVTSVFATMCLPAFGKNGSGSSGASQRLGSSDGKETGLRELEVPDESNLKRR
jgi:hypothetical protein